MNNKYLLFESLLIEKKWAQDVKVKKGKMHNVLGLDEDESIESKYKTGESLAKALMSKLNNEKEVTGMLAFAANVNSDNNVFDAALHYMKKIDTK